MFKTHFKHGTIRKYTAVFGSLFNELSIKRYDTNGDVIKTIPVPIRYGIGDPSYIKGNDNNSLDGHKIKRRLPAMAFNLTSFSYDAVRQGNKMNVLRNGTDTWQYMPVPYNLFFELKIATKNMEDGLQILEQILPFFSPILNVSLNDIPDIGIVNDIPLVLDSVTPNFSEVGDLTEDYTPEWTLTFTMKGFLYQPTKTSAIIKQVDVDIDNYAKVLESYNAAVNPLSANENDPHTIDETWVES